MAVPRHNAMFPDKIHVVQIQRFANTIFVDNAIDLTTFLWALFVQCRMNQYRKQFFVAVVANDRDDVGIGTVAIRSRRVEFVRDRLASINRQLLNGMGDLAVAFGQSAQRLPTDRAFGQTVCGHVPCVQPIQMNYQLLDILPYP